MKKIAIVGAGGHGQEVFCLWRERVVSEEGDFEFIGFFDDNPAKKSNKYGNVVGNIERLNSIGYAVGVAIAVGNKDYVKNIKSRIKNPNIFYPNIIHPSVAFLDRSNVEIGMGNILSVDCIVSCNTKIGDFNLLNNRVVIGHDVSLGNFNILNPNVMISGSVTIRDENFFGFNSAVLQGRRIGSNNTLSAGSILLRHIGDGQTYFGVPAKKMTLEK
ncbi:MAG: acetyltransferase [Bergeyella sp.]|nr:acetyltransferase [Bergeyella sp.]